jgi:hypothetical protein
MTGGACRSLRASAIGALKFIAAAGHIGQTTDVLCNTFECI